MLGTKYPGRSVEEYTRAVPLMPGIESMNMHWHSTSRDHYYGKSFGGCEGDVFDDLIAERETQARKLAMPMDPVGQGSGVSVIRRAPLKKEQLAGKNLYMVFESSRGPGFFDLDEKSYSIFFRYALYYMPDGPRLYPLNLSKESHAKLLDWYIEQGALEGRHTLIASSHKPEDIIKSLEHWYVLLWDEQEEAPRLVLTLANSGMLHKFFF